jgi:hypothetical protein
MIPEKYRPVADLFQNQGSKHSASLRQTKMGAKK